MHKGKQITIPLSEVLQMQRFTFNQMAQAVSGSTQAQEEIETVAEIACDGSADPRNRTYAIVSVCLLADACDQLAMLHHQQKQVQDSQTILAEGVAVPDVVVAGKCEHGPDAECQFCVKKSG